MINIRMPVIGKQPWLVYREVGSTEMYINGSNYNIFPTELQVIYSGQKSPLMGAKNKNRRKTEIYEYK